jgi:hypothetical protein
MSTTDCKLKNYFFSKRGCIISRKDYLSDIFKIAKRNGGEQCQGNCQHASLKKNVAGLLSYLLHKPFGILSSFIPSYM